MVQTLTKKFADVVGPDFRKVELDLEIENDDAAVRFCLDNEAFYFETYEISYAIVDGKEYHTDPENHSERNYVGVRGVHTADGILSNLELRLQKARTLRDEFSDERMRNLEEKIALFKADRPDARYIKEPESPGEYIRLNPGDRAYDIRGTQIWPAPARAP